MNNIKFITKDYDISKIRKRILDNPDQWEMVSKMVEEDKEKYGNGSAMLGPNSSGYLPLIMAVLDPKVDQIKNSDLVKPLETFYKYVEVRQLFHDYKLNSVSRAAFFKLPPGGKVPIHMDIGQYYETKDRYHLVIQGEYEYYVGDEMIIAKPGMFFWFNNKKGHGTVNTGNVDRITLVFDVPHHPSNPQHKL